MKLSTWCMLGVPVAVLGVSSSINGSMWPVLQGGQCCRAPMLRCGESVLHATE